MLPNLEQSGYVLDEQTGTWQRSNYAGIAYSDGDEVEGRLASIIAVAKDLSVLSRELREHCTDWPSLYHLSSNRANILRPFREKLTGSILEIGAGCGAITRFLGECGADVVALEGSPRRASIARSRTRDLQNVAVVSDTFELFKLDQKFDFVTLVGVLEYANIFTQAQHPALALLERARSFLKDGGKLIIAIENQLGLKYFAGAPEDHIGVPMYGVEGRYKSDQPQTFGRKVIADMLHQAGFKGVEVLAPFPDYKLPVSIVTEQGFNVKQFDAAAFAWQSVRRDPQLPPVLSFSPELVWPVIADNGLALDLSNSFLLVAGTDSERLVSEATLAWHFSADRLEEFCKQAEFVRVADHQIEVRYSRLSEKLVPNDTGLLNFNIPDKDVYYSGRNYAGELITVLSADGWKFSDVASYLSDYLSIIREEANKAGSSVTTADPTSLLPGNFIDYVPQNIMVTEDGATVIIDKEWTCNADLSLGFLVFRFLTAQLNSFSALGRSGEDFVGSRREFVLRTNAELGWNLDDTGIHEYFLRETELQMFATGRATDWPTYEQWLDAPASPKHAHERLLAEQLLSLSRGQAEAVISRDLIESLQSDIAASREIITHLKQQSADEEKSFNEQLRLIKEGQESIDRERSQYAGEQQKVIDSLKSHVTLRDGEIAMLSQRIAALDETLKVVDNLASSRAQELQALRASTSWRATGPVRRLAGILRSRTKANTEAIPEQSRPFAVETQPIPLAKCPVVVILPVYKDTQLTIECIESALPGIRALRNAKLLVLNDCSPEQDMTGSLAKLEAAHGSYLQVLTNEQNLGFVKTVNRGLELAAGADVVLLNSDVVVPRNWLTRLRAEAYSHSRAGTVTPLSNNTTICTFPEFLQDNPLPLGMSVEAVDQAFRNERLTNVAAPTGVGFCMYIRHDCLQDVGLLSAEHFPRGYGEENDFCQRAIARGWLNVITPNIFAYHKGGVSFGEEKIGLIANALATIDRLHPRYHRDVQNFIYHDPLKAPRLARLAALMASQPTPKVLHVCHALGGGTRKHVEELADFYTKTAQAFSLIIEPTSDKGTYVLIFGVSATSDRISFDIGEGLDAIIDLLKKIGIGLVHFHHLFGIDESIRGIPEAIGAKYYFTAHDYYLIGGNPTLTDERGEFDVTSPYAALNPLYSEVQLSERERFLDDSRAFLQGAAKVIFPSHAAKALFDGVFSLQNTAVAYHLEQGACLSSPTVSRPFASSKIIVGVLGALGKEKGADFLEAIACASRLKGLPFEFKLIGYAYRPLSNVHSTGPYKDSEVAGLLLSEKIDLLFYSARWPETYSYTLSLGLRSGLPIFAPAVGAFPERLSGHSPAALYDLSVPIDDLLDQLDLFCAAMRSGSLPTVSQRPNGGRDPVFYEKNYLAGPGGVKLSKTRRSIPELVYSIVDNAPEVTTDSWSHSTWTMVNRLYNVPGVIKLRNSLPPVLRSRLKRLVIKVLDSGK